MKSLEEIENEWQKYRGDVRQFFKKAFQAGRQSILEELKSEMPEERRIRLGSWLISEDCDYTEYDVNSAYNQYRSQVLEIIKKKETK